MISHSYNKLTDNLPYQTTQYLYAFLGKYLNGFRKYAGNLANRATFLFLVSNRKRRGTGYMYIPLPTKKSRSTMNP